MRETQFRKSRIVPLHATTVAQLHRYTTRRTARRYAACADIFFVSEQGHPLTSRALGQGFAQLCRQLGLGPTAEDRRSSLRALRHAFAIERLRRWHHEGAAVQTLLLHLAVDLGPVRSHDSSWS